MDWHWYWFCNRLLNLIKQQKKNSVFLYFPLNSLLHRIERYNEIQHQNKCDYSVDKTFEGKILKVRHLMSYLQNDVPLYEINWLYTPLCDQNMTTSHESNISTTILNHYCLRNMVMTFVSYAAAAFECKAKRSSKSVL